MHTNLNGWLVMGLLLGTMAYALADLPAISQRGAGRGDHKDLMSSSTVSSAWLMIARRVPLAISLWLGTVSGRRVG